MSSSDEELVAFWAARLDEEEAAAKAALSQSAEEGTRWWFDDAEPETPREFHVALHDPARALREVEADRRILASYADFCREVEEQRAERGEVGPGVWAAYRKLCDVIRIRAVVHRGHPDYQERWSP